MKSVVNNWTRYFVYFVFAFAAISLTGCSSDDDVVAPAPTGSIEVEDQTISENQVRVDQVVSSSDGFLVARHITGTGAILAQESINEGTHNDVVLQLDDQGTGVDLQDGDAVVVALYADTNADGNFNEATDALVATETVVVSSPSFDADDQEVVDNTMTFTNVNTPENSVLVAFGENEDGTINEDEILGQAPVQAGVTENVSLTFQEGRAPQPGHRIHTRMYRDLNNDGIYDPGVDLPSTFGFNQAPANDIRRTTTVL